MENSLILILVSLVLIVALLFLILYIMKRIKRGFQQSGIGEFVNLVKEADISSQLTPKSISGGDVIFLPLIMRDFPDFDLSFAKSVIDNHVLRSYEDIIYTGNSTATVSNPELHRTAISNYTKTTHVATITFQTAFQYKEQKNNEAAIIIQERCETEYTFYFDEEKTDTNTKSLAMRCSYCGAPFDSMSITSCSYCGNGITMLQDKVWKINKVLIK